MSERTTKDLFAIRDQYGRDAKVAIPDPDPAVHRLHTGHLPIEIRTVPVQDILDERLIEAEAELDRHRQFLQHLEDSANLNARAEPIRELIRAWRYREHERELEARRDS